MADFFSERFGKNVWISNHARQRMLWRNVDLALLQKIVETGTIQQRDSENAWIFSEIEGRLDNLICAAVIEQKAVVVKTVMVNWEQEN